MSELAKYAIKLYTVETDMLIPSDLHNAINDCFKAALTDFRKIRNDLKARGKNVTRLDELIAEFADLIGKLRYVEPGDDVLSQDTNTFIDLCKKMLEIDDEISALL